jgi:plastocyanin
MTDQKNVFQKIEEQSKVVPDQNAQQATAPAAAVVEFDMNRLSDVAVGDRVKYTRESLDGKTVTIERVQIFPGDPTGTPGAENSDVKLSIDKQTKMVNMKFLMTFDLKNSDGINHREYLSGARQFVQKDGSLSEPSFWYATEENARISQVAALWEKVAAAKGVEADRMSPREFMAFLNNKPKAKIVFQKQSAYPGSAPVSKNIVGGFL